MKNESKINQIEESLNIDLQFQKRNNLLPVVMQDFDSKEILILAYTNQEAFQKTLETGFVVLWSTSRQKIWKKGESSGDLLKIKEIYIDCDQDSLIYKVIKLGKGVCHTNDPKNPTQKRDSCFYRKVDLNSSIFPKLEFLK